MLQIRSYVLQLRLSTVKNKQTNIFLKRRIEQKRRGKKEGNRRDTQGNEVLKQFKNHKHIDIYLYSDPEAGKWS